MKSFTHNHTNIQSLRSDKRVEVLLKQEMMEHQHIISSHHSEMQALRDNLSLAVEKFESLSNRNEQDLKEFKSYAHDHISLLKDAIIANCEIITEQKKTIQDLFQQINEFKEFYVSKVSLDKVKKSFEIELKENTTRHINSFQEYQQETKVMVNSLRDDLNKFKSLVEQKFAEILVKMESNFYVSKIDREGVLKQVRIYEKSMFVIEKKIENIYTLIERINKKVFP